MIMSLENLENSQTILKNSASSKQSLCANHTMHNWDVESLILYSPSNFDIVDIEFDIDAVSEHHLSLCNVPSWSQAPKTITRSLIFPFFIPSFWPNESSSCICRIWAFQVCQISQQSSLSSLGCSLWYRMILDCAEMFFPYLIGRLYKLHMVTDMVVAAVCAKIIFAYILNSFTILWEFINLMRSATQNELLNYTIPEEPSQIRSNCSLYL